MLYIEDGFTTTEILPLLGSFFANRSVFFLRIFHLHSLPRRISLCCLSICDCLALYLPGFPFVSLWLFNCMKSWKVEELGNSIFAFSTTCCHSKNPIKRFDLHIIKSAKSQKLTVTTSDQRKQSNFTIWHPFPSLFDMAVNCETNVSVQLERRWLGHSWVFLVVTANGA